MATEEQATALPGAPSFGKWSSWVAGLLGLWVLVSPFLLTGEIAEAPGLYSNVVAGLVVFVLAIYAAFWVRTGVGTGTFSVPELAGWVTALVGLWIAATPFVLSGAFGSGTALYSNVAAGFIAIVFGAYVGWYIHTTE